MKETHCCLCRQMMDKWCCGKSVDKAVCKQLEKWLCSFHPSSLNKTSRASPKYQTLSLFPPAVFLLQLFPRFPAASDSDVVRTLRPFLLDSSLCLLRFSCSLPFVSCQCLSTPFVLRKRCVSICFPFECLSLCPPLPKFLLYTWIKEYVSLCHHCFCSFLYLSSNSCLRISSSFSLCMCPPCSLSPSTGS